MGGMTVRPDAKGRITLGKMADGISSFRVIQEANGCLTLEPYAEIPAREKWLFDNPAALSQIKRGLEQAAEGRVRSLGSFADDADNSLDE